jgi:hypothetical protein
VEVTIWIDAVVKEENDIKQTLVNIRARQKFLTVKAKRISTFKSNLFL